jgi:hypothetical protein
MMLAFLVGLQLSITIVDRNEVEKTQQDLPRLRDGCASPINARISPFACV